MTDDELAQAKVGILATILAAEAAANALPFAWDFGEVAVKTAYPLDPSVTINAGVQYIDCSSPDRYVELEDMERFAAASIAAGFPERIAPLKVIGPGNGVNYFVQASASQTMEALRTSLSPQSLFIRRYNNRVNRYQLSQSINLVSDEAGLADWTTDHIYSGWQS